MCGQEEKRSGFPLGSLSNLSLIIWIPVQSACKKRIYLRCIFNCERLESILLTLKVIVQAVGVVTEIAVFSPARKATTQSQPYSLELAWESLHSQPRSGTSSELPWALIAGSRVPVWRCVCDIFHPLQSGACPLSVVHFKMEKPQPPFGEQPQHLAGETGPGERF